MKFIQAYLGDMEALVQDYRNKPSYNLFAGRRSCLQFIKMQHLWSGIKQITRQQGMPVSLLDDRIKNCKHSDPPLHYAERTAFSLRKWGEGQRIWEGIWTVHYAWFLKLDFKSARKAKCIVKHMAMNFHQHLCRENYREVII